MLRLSSAIHVVFEMTQTKAFAWGVRFVLTAIVFLRIFSVDIYPWVSPDSGHYLGKALSGELTERPISIIQPRHYKTAGYPLYLAGCHAIGEALDQDGSLIAVLGQRMALFTAILWLILRFGLLALPLAWFFSLGTFAATGNFVLTEGLTIPASICFGLAVIGLFERRSDPAAWRRPTTWALAAALAATYGFLVLTKIPCILYATALVPVAVGIRLAGWRPRLTATRFTALGASLVGLSFAYLVAVTVDNHAQFGRFTPGIGQARVFYWALWTQAFQRHPELRSKRSLKGFREGGPYRFLKKVEKKCGGLDKFRCTMPPEERQAKRLVKAAGLSLARERAAAFAWGLIGGSKKEIVGTCNRILAANGKRASVARLHAAMEKKHSGLFGGDERTRYLPGLGGAPQPAEEVLTPERVLTILLAAVLAVLAAIRRIPFASPAVFGALTYAVVVASLAWMLCDVWRYVVPAWSLFAVTSLSALAKVVDRAITERRSACAGSR